MRLKWLVIGAVLLGLGAVGVGAALALRGGEGRERKDLPPPTPVARGEEAFSRKIAVSAADEPETPPEDEWPEEESRPREEEPPPAPVARETGEEKRPDEPPPAVLSESKGARVPFNVLLSVEPPLVKPGGELRARVRLEGSVPAGEAVAVECRDALGGVLFRSRREAAGKHELEFVIELRAPVVSRHVVRARCAGKEAEAGFAVELAPPVDELASFAEREGVLFDRRGRAIEPLRPGAEPRRPDGTFALLVRPPAAESEPENPAARVRRMKSRTAALVSEIERARPKGLLVGAEAGAGLDLSAVAREAAFLATDDLGLARALQKPVLCEPASVAHAWRALLYGARWFKGGHPDFPSGLAELMARASFSTDPVAIYYSPASLAVGGRDMFDAAFRLVQGAGFQGRAVSIEALVSGKVRETGYRLLYLPGVACLSAEEARSIEEFASHGGTVVADVCPGAYDPSGAKMPLVRMDSFFGVLRMRRHPATPVGVRFVAGALAGRKLKVAPAEPEVAPLPVDDGYPEVHGRAKSDVPVFVVMRHGRGRSVLLNLRTHSAEPGSPEELDAALVVRACMTLAELKPQLELTSADGTPAPGVEFVSWQNGGQGIVAFLSRSGKQELKAVLHRKREYAVYDAVRGKYLGSRKEIVFSSAPEAPAVFVFDSELAPISLKASAAFSEGELKVEALFEGGNPGVRAAHLELLRPDGSPARRYSRVLFTEFDSVDASLTFALDEPPGEWTARLRDAATGTTAEARFGVEK